MLVSVNRLVAKPATGVPFTGAIHFAARTAQFFVVGLVKGDA